MSIALYRKYRPQKFGDVTNQNHIKLTLQNEVSADKLAHAYLFCGPRGTGKTTLARLLSKAVNCQNLQENAEPCNECESCLEIMENKSLDIIEIDAASHTGVDNVRENIISNSRFTPAKSKYKVFIIDEVHMLSTQAFNALLKTLEEPPAYVIFILATTEVYKVPVTIISRCQRFDFQKISLPQLVDRLNWICDQEKVKVDEKVLNIIAQNSGGCVRDAESLLEQILSLGNEKVTLEEAQLVLPRADYLSLLQLFEFLINKNQQQAIAFINDLVQQGVDITQFYSLFLGFLRKILIYTVNKDILLLQSEFEQQIVDKIVKMADNMTSVQVVNMINVLLQKKEVFKNSHILQLPLEIAVLEIINEDLIQSQVNLPASKKKVSEEVKPLAVSVEEKKINEPQFGGQVNELEEKKSEENELKEKTVKEDGEEIVEKKQPKEDVKVTEVKTEIQEKKDSVAQTNNITLTFNQVLSRWPLIISQVKNENYSLGMSLSVAKPVKLEKNNLTLGFLFELQKEIVEKPTNKKIVIEAFEKEFCTGILLDIVVDNSLKLSDITNAENVEEEIKVEQPEVTNDPVKDALNSFGGTLVDKI